MATGKKSKASRARKPADIEVRKGEAANRLAMGMPHNVNKASEYTADWATPPPAGETLDSDDPSDFGSTLSESIKSAKVGEGETPEGACPLNGSLDRVRVDATGQPLTTNQGVPVADNQSSLKAGVRGPTLLEDLVLREKITHFDHERIPERVVHARGSGAHGYFECYDSLREHTRASVFAERGKRTPVFVRFSTVLGERGSADTVRDVRGFAVKFYTDEGNWDLVGNNIPIFFIQDAMKFPDLVHAAKPEPHMAIPQAASAHDTFWDFVSLMPESTAMLLWVMSDRGIPRSYRTMQGFGVHTFRFVNADGESSFVKFHWTPAAGTHSLVWDEAVKIAGADADFHRRDLWEAIESGNFPEYELGVQIFSEAEAEEYTFDVLDATKLVPEELVPVMPVGKMVLNRNPDNFFAETEQVAFCTAHLVPGIDFSNDPLLAGRIHSYVDTQISRLGGANFHEIPINAALSPVHNNQRDGMHRQAIPRGRVAYEPNSLGGGCPFQAGAAGFTSFPEARAADEHKMRGKPERFAEHYAQATLFWASQTPAEQRHIVGGFRFELSKVTVPAIRERIVASLRNVSADLAEAVAAGIGIDELPEPMLRAMPRPPKAEVGSSPALSLLARPGDGGIRGRRVALIVHDGIDVGQIDEVRAALAAGGAVPKLVGLRLGTVRGEKGASLAADATLENSPGVLFDGCVLPDGERAVELLARDPACLAFVQDQYQHCKPILALGAASLLLDKAAIPLERPDGSADPALILGPGANAVAGFIEAVGKHRDFSREAPP